MKPDPRSCCGAIDAHFSADKAHDLEASLTAAGPPRETTLLFDALTNQGIAGMSVLDVGAGIGVLAEQLITRGARSAVLVDISSAYLDAARQRLARLSDVQFRHGDIIELADELDDADIVTLDKVVCCYPDYRELVSKSAGKAKRFYAASYPRDRWVVRVAIWFENFVRRLRGNVFRAYVHPVSSLEALLQQHGFEALTIAQTFQWRCALFVRTRAQSGRAESEPR